MHLRTQRKGAIELIEQSVSDFCPQFYGLINPLNLSKAHTCKCLQKSIHLEFCCHSFLLLFFVFAV